MDYILTIFISNSTWKGKAMRDSCLEKENIANNICTILLREKIR